MKILRGVKDGGPDSKVWAWGVEIKWLFSILVLRFDRGSREAFHTHAFNAISWVIQGSLEECRRIRNGEISFHKFITYSKSWVLPILTRRDHLHMVKGVMDRNWVLSIRGPWEKQWVEIDRGQARVLTHGRKVIHDYPA